MEKKIINIHLTNTNGDIDKFIEIDENEPFSKAMNKIVKGIYEEKLKLLEKIIEDDKKDNLRDPEYMKTVVYDSRAIKLVLAAISDKLDFGKEGEYLGLKELTQILVGKEYLNEFIFRYCEIFGPNDETNLPEFELYDNYRDDHVTKRVTTKPVRSFV